MVECQGGKGPGRCCDRRGRGGRSLRPRGVAGAFYLRQERFVAWPVLRLLRRRVRPRDAPWTPRRSLSRDRYVLCLRRRRLSQLASANQPPSTERVCPLTKPLHSRSARKATALATSSGAAKRAIGTRPSMSASV